MGSGVGVAAGLYTAGVLSKTQITILMPAIYLMGAQVQYLGRILGTAGVRPHKMYFIISIVNAAIGMLIMRFLA
jgi:spore maturation protein SpmB